MPKMRTYLVSFSPAEKTAYGYSVAISLLTTGDRHEIQADNFRDLEAQVRRLAREFGRTCSPYVRMARGERNPPGFTDWRRGVEFIEFVPEPAA